MAQIGQPVRRYTVIPLNEPVAPSDEPVLPPRNVPTRPAPVIKPEPEPAK